MSNGIYDFYINDHEDKDDPAHEFICDGKMLYLLPEEGTTSKDIEIETSFVGFHNYQIYDSFYDAPINLFPEKSPHEGINLAGIYNCIEQVDNFDVNFNSVPEGLDCFMEEEDLKFILQDDDSDALL